MHQARLGLFALSFFLASASGQVTGTYPVSVTSSGPPGTAGTVLSNYPQCALNCAASVQICADINDPGCQCGVANRGNTSACQTLACSNSEFLHALALSDDFCGPVYTATPSLGVAVSSAIVSATAAARSALSTRSPDDLGDYPACAQRCAGLSQTLCMGNRECVCRCPAVQATEGPCEVANCSRADLDLATFLVFDLCAPVGGLQPKLESACRSDNMTTPSSTIGTASSVLFTSSPTASPITPFMGEGYALGARSLEAALAVFAGGVGVMVFLL